ncbi:hypothetical protein ACK9YZ_00735 [Rhizobium sp. ZK1]|uniref:hypothetical protein n=1 Tax=Rhizobium sp. ZK1 TaxID=3389872 RepID=UPI0039F66256
MTEVFRLRNLREKPQPRGTGLRFAYAADLIFNDKYVRLPKNEIIVRGRGRWPKTSKAEL